MNKLRKLFGFDVAIDEEAHLVDVEQLRIDDIKLEQSFAHLRNFDRDDHLVYLHSIQVTRVEDVHFQVVGGLSSRLNHLELRWCINPRVQRKTHSPLHPRMMFLNHVLANGPRIGADALEIEEIVPSQYEILVKIPAAFFERQKWFRFYALIYVSPLVRPNLRKTRVFVTPVATRKYSAALRRAFRGPTKITAYLTRPVSLQTPSYRAQEAIGMKILVRTILVLVANPVNQEHLHLSDEIKAIREVVLQATYRDAFRVEDRWEVGNRDFREALILVDPTVLHYSGHSTDQGELVLVAPDGTAKLASKRTITRYFAPMEGRLRCVFLNACHSLILARRLARYVDVVIGMPGKVRNDHAIAFARDLYRALVEGHSVGAAYDGAMTCFEGERESELVRPRMLVKKGVNTRRLVLVPPGVVGNQ